MHGDLTDRSFWEKGYERKETAFSRLGHTRQNAIFRGVVGYVHRLIKARYVDPGSIQILELGGGNSDWLGFWGKKYRCGLWAIDYSARGCHLLERKLKNRGLHGTIINKDFLDVEATDVSRPIDIFFSIGFLEHFIDRRGIYRLAQRLLAPGGVFVAVVPNLTGLNLSWVGRANPLLLEWHVSLPKSKVIAELVDHHFEDVRGEFVGGVRLFADARGLGFSITKRAVNLAGEVISRIANVSSEWGSPYYVVSGNKSD